VLDMAMNCCFQRCTMSDAWTKKLIGGVQGTAAGGAVIDFERSIITHDGQSVQYPAPGWIDPP
jgi:hypothetical protein